MSFTNLNKLSLLCLVVGICALAGFADAASDVNKIVGGTPTNIESHSFMLILKLDDEFICGACLIAPKTALTAGHCLVGNRPQQITVTGGTTSVSGTGVTAKVLSFDFHPEYNAETRANDIAVMKLDRVLSGPTISIIPLGKGPLNANMIITALGWGKLFEDGPASKNLQTVNLPLISKSDCTRAYRRKETLYPSQFCAQGKGTDTCQGDSGGPVVLNSRVVGVVSWGWGCAQPGLPGVYTSINYVIKWLQQYAKA